MFAVLNPHSSSLLFLSFATFGTPSSSPELPLHDLLFAGALSSSRSPFRWSFLFTTSSSSELLPLRQSSLFVISSSPELPLLQNAFPFA
jgi:hypothetical protein